MAGELVFSRRHWFRLMSYALLSQISGHYRWRKS